MSHFAQSYSYDKVNRLTGVSDTGGYNRTFSYDPYGNMAVSGSTGVPWSGLTPSSSGGATPFNAGNNQVNSGVYDAAGNQTAMGSLQIGYNAENRQTSTQDGVYPATAYAYDGKGRRVKKTLAGGGTTVYVYDAFERLAAEYTDGAAYAAPCRTCYLTRDYLGSVRMVTSETRMVVSLHDYLPFGEEIPANTAGRTGSFGGFENVRQRFTGQERDDTNLDYFEARYLASVQGRFLSPDPANAGADLLNPQSWNGYSYVLNNPLANVDPTGACTVGADGVARDDAPGDCGGGSTTVDGGGSDPIDTFPIDYCRYLYCGGGGFGSGGGSGGSQAPTITAPVVNSARSARNDSKACVNPSFAQRAIVTGLSYLSQRTGLTIGYGTGGSIGAGKVQ